MAALGTAFKQGLPGLPSWLVLPQGLFYPGITLGELAQSRHRDWKQLEIGSSEHEQ